ncbi:CesD/SycD/LcrH family type III secretion system chaperone [Burkholderia stabilis]|uniref:CesD/SycD/LcrH family type III secretion system chaperone n=1 Tax=Burkholderia stabilis TaxID=95485 RepID=A0A4Q2AB40_9BURK|nr:CesD/SycD/LcrH family type III secretion system chaperone [Burkholderia stabilis]
MAILQGKASLAEMHGYDPVALEHIYERGYDAWNSGDRDSATLDFGLLTLLQPLDRRFHFAFACGLQSQGEFSHALTFFNYAISMQADDPFAAFHIGECLLGLGEFDAARDAFEAAISQCYGVEDGSPATDHLRARAETHLIKLND